MADTEVAELVGVGHNSEAGLPTIAELTERLLAENAEALARTAALLAKGEEFLVIDSDEKDSEATEFMVKVRARWKFSEADRVAAVTPWDDRRGAAHAFFKTKILDLLGLAPPKGEEMFDPRERPDLGLGPRINRAQTIFKLAKAEKERRAREVEAQRLREIEAKAALARKVAEDAARAVEDEKRRVAQAAAAKAAQEAVELAQVAARKRSAENKAVADAAAQEAARAAEAANLAARAEEENQVAARAQRDEDARAAENKLAEERAAAEASASVSLADLSRSRGGRGGVASLRESVEHRDVNRDTLDYAMLGPYFTDKAVKSAIDAYADANKATVSAGIKANAQPVKGVTFYIAAKNAGRA